MLEFKNTDLSYVEEAVKLAKKEYEEECIKNPQLLHTDFSEQITNLVSYLFQQPYGKVALQNGTLIGYLAFEGPWDGFFGNVKGTFSPLGGSAFSGKERNKLASMLFEATTAQMAEDGVCSYALSRFAHDEEVGTSFVMNGFGIRCSDAMLHLKNRKIVDKLDSWLEFCELFGAEKRQTKELQQGLIRHLASAPAFFPSDISDFEEELDRAERRLFAVKKQGKIMGYMALKMDEAETYITGNEKVANICGAYIDRHYRGGTLAQQLLEYLCQVCEREGMEYLGVDCETLNPTALRFWGKNFSNYTYSYARRIDERVVGYSSYLANVWGE